MQTALRNITRRSVAIRSFASSARYQSASVHGNDPHVIETEKQKNLAGKQHESAPHKSHAPGWNETLASDSEANVKADQAPHSSPSDLTSSTIDYVKKKHDGSAKQSAAADEDHEHASYDKEEVRGPLAGKGKQT